MKTVVILVNCFVLVFGLWNFAELGMPTDLDDVVFIFCLIVCPIVNIIALYFWGRGSGGWLWLYFKRKALEEKKKIDALNNAVSEDEQNQ